MEPRLVIPLDKALDIGYSNPVTGPGPDALRAQSGRKKKPRATLKNTNTNFGVILPYELTKTIVDDTPKEYHSNLGMGTPDKGDSDRIKAAQHYVLVAKKAKSPGGPHYVGSDDADAIMETLRNLGAHRENDGSLTHDDRRFSFKAGPDGLVAVSHREARSTGDATPAFAHP